MPSFHLHGRSLLSSSLSIFHLSFSLLRHLPSSTFSFRANQNNPRFLSSKETPVITHAVTPLFMSPLVYLPSIPLPLIPFPLSRHSAKPYFPFFSLIFFFFIFHLFPFHLPTLSIIIHLPSFPLFPILHPIPQAPYPALTPSNPLPTFPLLLSFSPSTPASFLPSLPNSFWSGLAPCVVPDGSGRVGLPLSTIAGCIPTVTAAGVGLYRGPVGE